jgi:hypothetical protein
VQVFLLCIKAELENIKEIRIRPGHRFCFAVGAATGIHPDVANTDEWTAPCR